MKLLRAILYLKGKAHGRAVHIKGFTDRAGSLIKGTSYCVKVDVSGKPPYKNMAKPLLVIQYGKQGKQKTTVLSTYISKYGIISCNESGFLIGVASHYRSFQVDYID